MSEVESENSKVIGVVCCDFERTAIGTRSRLREVIGGKRVLERVVERLLRVEGLGEVVLCVVEGQEEIARGFGFGERVKVMTLVGRSEGISGRVKAGRAWNLMAWRGGAGQWTCFDEEYHPAGIAAAAKMCGAEGGHVLHVHSHSVVLDVEMTSALIRHHLHKNHEMRVTYTPSAPGICGMVLRGDIVMEMGEKGAMPWQLLAYDPSKPTFDTLIRDACMQVDPALSKVGNRFCVDTERSFGVVAGLIVGGEWVGSSAEMALAAARVVAPGVVDFSRGFGWPREVEVELTGKRKTSAPGSVPAVVREGRGELDVGRWVRWWEGQRVCDDLRVTIGGDGDPLLYGGLVEVLRAVRKAGVLSVCVQTDLVTPPQDGLGGLRVAIEEGLVDVVSVMTYGGTAGTYAKVAGADLYSVMMGNMRELAPLVSGRGGVPVVVPRLLKVRETVPEMEGFFDGWIQQAGWGVIDYPTDRAGQVAFAGVVEMGPAKRRPCRRIWERMVVRANGNGVACDQDMMDRLVLGNIEGRTLAEMWGGVEMSALRGRHGEGEWGGVVPCVSCREWHRA
ncbi:MAG: SPASM domain-containing protein [Phycisphaerae bacterium]